MLLQAQDGLLAIVTECCGEAEGLQMTAITWRHLSFHRFKLKEDDVFAAAADRKLVRTDEN